MITLIKNYGVDCSEFEYTGIRATGRHDREKWRNNITFDGTISIAKNQILPIITAKKISFNSIVNR